MPTQAIFQRAFSAGELAPVLHARADTVKYVQGLRTCRNFIVRREGGAMNRAGLRFVGAAKTATAGTRLKRFVTATAGVSFLVELGSGYFRFWQNGAPVTVSGVVAWSNVTNYVPGDLVVSGGINYYCFAANVNQVPPNGAFWYPLTGNIYEIPTPYSLSQLPNWDQSENVVTLTNPNVVPQELLFFSSVRWVLQPVTTAAAIGAPTALGASGGNPIPAWDATVQYTQDVIIVSGGVNYIALQPSLNKVPPNAIYWAVVATPQTTVNYKVTAISADTLEEGPASTPLVVNNLLRPTATLPNVLTWTPPAGTVDSYNVYSDPVGNGIFGLVGNSPTAGYNDTGTLPDFLQTPPVLKTLFANVNERPSCSQTYQQRRFFADTFLIPDAVFGSKTGLRSNFNISSPLQEDDAVTFRLAGNNHHPVRHMRSLNAGLILLTDGGEWTATGANGPLSSITPNSILALEQTYVGIAATVPPVVVGDTIVYVQSRGTIVRELGFQQSAQGWAPAGADLTTFATHLFEDKTVVAIDFQQTPDSIIWCVRSDGTLLGLTYVRDQEIVAWHRHDTGQNATSGSIEDVCVVPEATQDAVYVLVKRTIGGSDVRYIERLNSRIMRSGFFNADCFFVDAGLSYSGAPASSFAGLGHLEGQVVAVVADGQVLNDGDPLGPNAAAFTVTGGVINTPVTVPPTLYTNVHIGLRIAFQDLETLDIDVQGADIRQKQKKINGIFLLIERSSRAFLIGPDATQLTKYAPDTWEPTDKAQTGLFELNITATYAPQGRVYIRQQDPLPLTILGVIPDVEVGG